MKHNYVLKIAFFFLLVLGGKTTYSQTFYDMSSANYSQNFSNISAWTNNYAGGTGAQNWRVATSVATSTLNTTTVFSTTTSGGVQKGTEAMILLASGTNSTGTDLLLNFSGRNAGTISLDWSKITNTVNVSPRSSDLKIQYSVDNGVTFTDLTGYTIPRVLNNSTAESGSLSSIALPSALNNQSQVVIRFFVWNNAQTGGSGNRPKIQLDNIAVTSTASVNPSLGFNTASSAVTETNSTFNTLIPVTIINYAAPVSISVTVTGGTAESGDYTLNTTSISFTADGTQNISLDINNDADRDNETIIIDIAITSGTSNISTSQHTVTITDDELPNIIINEILADPTGIDANGDGTISTSQDEFVELVNLDSEAINLSGFTLSDATTVQHTFAAVSIPAGGSIVIFGGGTPTGISGLTGVGSGSLSLNNTGDTVILKNAGGTTIATYTYGSEANNDQSIGRSNDLSGGFVQHTTISSNPVAASPGRYNTTNQPFSTNTWTGATSTDWAVASNWSLGTVPTSGDNVQIIKATNQPVANSAVTVSSVTIASDASLIANSTFTGTVTYNRSLGTSNWYLMSSPVAGVTFNDAFVTANNIDSGTGNNKGVATYTTASNTWSYLQAAGSIASSAGIGYSVKRTASGNVAFTGTLNTSNVSVAVSNAGNGFNLIGNPFTAAINSASFLTDNTTNLASQTLWVFNQSTGVYETKITGDTFIVAPTQGFFIKANTTTDLNIAESYQTTGGTFQKTARTEVILNMTDGSNNRYAKMYYLANATKGFDNGYDGEVFGGIENAVDLFTHLVANNEGKKFQIQSLPISEMESMIVPVGVKAAAGKEITFTAEALNLPNDVKVFLEDKVANTITRLDETNATYKVTLSETLDGIGRFYLHTKTAGVLSTEDALLESVSIYAPSKSTLRIEGISQGSANVRIFSILGKEVFANNYKTSGIIEVNLPALSSGLYVIQVATEKGNINKKITLE